MSDRLDKSNSHQLLKKAASCYLKAGWLSEACRVWKQIGDYHQAAQIYEEQENWAEAASCYRQAQNWSKAANCYLKDGQAEAAAQCLLEAGETLKAAWIWVSQLKQVYRTREALSSFVPQTETQELEIELITAHCEASTGKKRESAIRLREQLDSLLEYPQAHLYEWALTIAQAIKRPDLAALIHATAVRAKLPNAVAVWETWALEKLGDATGIPKEETAGNLKSYEFEVVTVNRTGEIITRQWQQAEYFLEPLGNGIDLEMVYIPGGTFLMGSPENEGYDWEKPQHQVSVEQFYLGKFQVTQAQWRAVAKLPQMERELNPDPSRFKGENRPVEQVSWHDAEEFCQRLSKATGREYSLPSEAEWEYACRAGTTTPFHYGETITSELANYRGSSTYGDEPGGEDRGETTPVGNFPPNSFGLYDMHGNVREWCADPWHENYEGAPKEGRVWGENGNNNRSHVLRGGSWYDNPRNCRSAYRNDYVWRGFIDFDVGFRVRCGVGRT